MYLKTKKPAEQISKQNKKERKKGKRRSLAEFKPGTFARPHMATTPLRMIT